MSFVLFASFRAGFLSKVAVKERELALDSLEALPGSGMKAVIVTGGSTRDVFEGAAEGSLLNQIWEKNIRPFGEDTLVKGKEKRQEMASQFLVCLFAKQNWAYLSAAFSRALRLSCAFAACAACVCVQRRRAKFHRRKVVWSK